MSQVLVTNHFKQRAQERCGIANFDRFINRMMTRGIVLYNAMGFKSKKVLFSKYIYDQTTDTISVIAMRESPYALVTIYMARETAWFPKYRKKNNFKELPRAKEEGLEPVFPETEGAKDEQTSLNS